MCIYIYIYTYIHRERDRERDTERDSCKPRLHVCVCVCRGSARMGDPRPGTERTERYLKLNDDDDDNMNNNKTKNNTTRAFWVSPLQGSFRLQTDMPNARVHGQILGATAESFGRDQFKQTRRQDSSPK